jgi:ATP-dependent helicase/nuclease subunit B
VELVEAADRRGEVNAVARRIGELLRARHRLRDVAVLCRDLGEYDELISASFREHGIPFFADRRRSATHHPLLVFTRAVFEIARAEWPGDAVMGLAKSGLAQMSADEADELENYVLLHRIRSGAWEDAKPWTYARTIRRDEDDEPFRVEREQARRMDEVRRKLVDLLAPFLKVLQKPATVRQIVTALFELYQRFEVTRTLSLWMEQATAANKTRAARRARTGLGGAGRVV